MTGNQHLHESLVTRQNSGNVASKANIRVPVPANAFVILAIIVASPNGLMSFYDELRPSRQIIFYILIKFESRCDLYPFGIQLVSEPTLNTRYTEREAYSRKEEKKFPTG